jgi:hypothetical protein
LAATATGKCHKTLTGHFTAIEATATGNYHKTLTGYFMAIEICLAIRFLNFFNFQL